MAIFNHIQYRFSDNYRRGNGIHIDTNTLVVCRNSLRVEWPSTSHPLKDFRPPTAQACGGVGHSKKRQGGIMHVGHSVVTGRKSIIDKGMVVYRPPSLSITKVSFLDCCTCHCVTWAQLSLHQAHHLFNVAQEALKLGQLLAAHDTILVSACQLLGSFRHSRVRINWQQYFTWSPHGVTFLPLIHICKY